jgi:hypothetical protein
LVHGPVIGLQCGCHEGNPQGKFVQGKCQIRALRKIRPASLISSAFLLTGPCISTDRIVQPAACLKYSLIYSWLVDTELGHAAAAWGVLPVYLLVINSCKLQELPGAATPTGSPLKELLLLLLHRTNTADQADGPEIALVIR